MTEGVGRRFFLKSLVSAAFVAGFAPKVTFLESAIPDPLNEMTTYTLPPDAFKKVVFRVGPEVIYVSGVVPAPVPGTYTFRVTRGRG